MYDVKNDAKGEYRRVEVLTGPGRRRSWSADEKARIVSETLAPGARVSDVARRWQVCSSQVFTWRRQARASSAPSPMGFVPIVAEAAPAVSARPAPPTATSASIDIRLAGAVVRVAAGAEDNALLTAVLRAVRASASRE
jgi:transposase